MSFQRTKTRTSSPLLLPILFERTETVRASRELRILDDGESRSAITAREREREKERGDERERERERNGDQQTENGERGEHRVGWKFTIKIPAVALPRVKMGGEEERRGRPWWLVERVETWDGLMCSNVGRV